MKTITKLTRGQEARFPEFVDKWNRIGLSTEPANRPETEKGIVEAYRVAGLAAPKIVWCGSPLSQGLTRATVFQLSTKMVVRDSVGDSVGDSVWASVRDSVWDSVGASVRDSVWASVRDSVGDSVGASVGDSVWDSVWASVWDSVGASVRDSVWASVRDSVGDSVGASGYGQHDAGWVSFYDFFRAACQLVDQTEKLKGIQVITENGGWWLPHQKLCWVSERHCVLHRNSVGRLHKDQAAALEYPDGFCIYALNGIRMTPEQVLTPAENISPELVLKETNADRRRELIRKVGIERMLAKLQHTLLEKRGDYELLSIHLSDEVRDARFLRMVNPSVGVFHLEGVHPDCKTITESLNWRNSNWHENAEVLT